MGHAWFSSIKFWSSSITLSDDCSSCLSGHMQVRLENETKETEEGNEKPTNWHLSHSSLEKEWEKRKGHNNIYYSSPPSHSPFHRVPWPLSDDLISDGLIRDNVSLLILATLHLFTYFIFSFFFTFWFILPLLLLWWHFCPHNHSSCWVKKEIACLQVWVKMYGNLGNGQRVNFIHCRLFFFISLVPLLLRLLWSVFISAGGFSFVSSSAC